MDVFEYFNGMELFLKLPLTASRYKFCNFFHDAISQIHLLDIMVVVAVVVVMMMMMMVMMMMMMMMMKMMMMMMMMIMMIIIITRLERHTDRARN